MTSNPEEYIGRTLGNYVIDEYIGYGAMARVFKGRHTILNRPGAIKILHPHFASDGEFLQQFVTEAQSLASLRHPNIVQVYDFAGGAAPYMVMEYIQGKTLKAILAHNRARNVRLPLPNSLRIIYSLSLALAYAHQRHVIHRDVKPSNVMIEESGRVVLADFGLARLTTRQSDTLTGTIKGTPAYMSPEQAMGQSSTPRSDIYSLGVIFYELVTGQLPFNDENPFAIAMKHVNDIPPDPRTLVPEIPEAVENIILKAMIKDDGQRYGTVNEFIHDLTKVRLRTKTTRLATATLSNLADLSDESSTWAPPDYVEHETKVCLNFIDTGQIINLESDREYTIGRRHDSQPIVPDIDLTPFKAFDWGISRLHAAINVREDSTVTVTDIGSSNGTWHGGDRLPPNQPHELYHGDVIYLGKLQIQVLIY